MACWPSMSSQGLSPRVRGNPPRRHRLPAAPGSIPACTGEPEVVRVDKPLIALGIAAFDEVYPRVYGGTFTNIGAKSTVNGLSPRVRGNLAGKEALAKEYGSIPACTGEPSLSRCRCCPRRVYPRVYGGTCAASKATIRTGGLSPRVRGNPCGHGPTSPSRRSIPACTGEPTGRLAGGSPGEVYPRVYGGTGGIDPESARGTGLSPRVRGNHTLFLRNLLGQRSIPACTGEPTSGSPSTASCRVYPRVYGGTSRVALRCWSVKGLSPRVRGNLHRCVVCCSDRVARHVCR